MKLSVGRQCGVSKSFVFERRSLRSDQRGNAEKAIQKELQDANRQLEWSKVRQKYSKAHKNMDNLNSSLMSASSQNDAQFLAKAVNLKPNMNPYLDR